MVETVTWPARHEPAAAPGTAPPGSVPPLLSVRDLTIEFTSRQGTLVAVDRVSFDCSHLNGRFEDYWEGRHQAQAA